MESVPANVAKTQFGDLLLKVQREPIQIIKNGKPVAVVLSMDEFEDLEAMKLRFLKERVARAKVAIEAGNTVDADTFFAELNVGKYD